MVRAVLGAREAAASAGEEGGERGEEAMSEAMRAVMLRPWELSAWDSLAYVRSQQKSEEP